MSDGQRNILDALEEKGVLQHVALQAHANLGIEPSRLLTRGPRLVAEMERIASDPQQIADAVEQFGPEVQRREMAQHQPTWQENTQRGDTPRSR